MLLKFRQLWKISILHQDKVILKEDFKTYRRPIKSYFAHQSTELQWPSYQSLTQIVLQMKDKKLLL